MFISRKRNSISPRLKNTFRMLHVYPDAFLLTFVKDILENVLI